ncbi:Detected protein of confused Function [Hibiscus syriacus]|uniref:Detected protein of confused Function n=1 Tax=Hibiscus syriacus TaxID=106335 RepID=A0A6A3BVN0_HIBSY|nr:Detected protein of confused Function [Hibiscus syriacus]
MLERGGAEEVSREEEGTWGKIDVARSGTAADKVSAFSFLVADNPVANLKSLDGLLGLVTSKVGKRYAFAGFEALKELFISKLLPDRKLKTLLQRPVNELPETKDGYSLLLFWYWEDCLKQRYERFVNAVEEASRDMLLALKDKALKTMYALLKRKPEQERKLLSSLINKLGDPQSKGASNADFYLSNLLSDHPNMKAVVIDEVDTFLFRPHLRLRAKYHAVNFLSQIRLSHRGNGPRVASGDGLFSVKSCRKALGKEVGGIELWSKGVWLGLSPPRVEAFLWQLAHQKVAVKMELVKRGMSLEEDVLCPFCKEHEETVQHLFISCFVVWELWNKLASFWDLSIVLPQDPPSLFNSWGSLRLNSLIWKFIPGVVFWLSKWFLAKYPKFPIQEDLLIGDPSLADGISVPKPKDYDVISWLPPPVDFLKMNVDGAVRLKDSIGGIGGILRDWNCCTLLTFSENIGQGPPPVAELKAIKRGIEIFLASRWSAASRLVVESDCKSAVEWIHTPSLAPVFMLPLVREILLILSGKVLEVAEVVKSYVKASAVLISEAGKSQQPEKENKAVKNSHRSKENKRKGSGESHVELDSRLLSALLMLQGVNRAFPYVSSNEADDIVDIETPILFQLVHSKNFNVGVQALMLLDKISSKNQVVSDRFYRALYSKLLLPAAMNSSKASEAEFG